MATAAAIVREFQGKILVILFLPAYTTTKAHHYLSESIVGTKKIVGSSRSRSVHRQSLSNHLHASDSIQWAELVVKLPITYTPCIIFGSVYRQSADMVMKVGVSAHRQQWVVDYYMVGRVKWQVIKHSWNERCPASCILRLN